MIAVLYAVLAAAGNAVGAVLQRRAARTIPQSETMRPALMLDLIRRPVWLGGVAALIAGFLFQAAALSVGDLTLVQPIVLAELPLTLVVAGIAYHSFLDRGAWIGAICVSVGLAAVLIATAPSGGHQLNGSTRWLFACAASVLAGAVLVAVGLRFSGGRRAVLLGAAAGLGFGFTAALMKGAMLQLPHGVDSVVASWQLYTMVAVGIVSFYLAQNALHAGTLVAAQPPISMCDPLVSVGFGVLLFGEDLRAGLWLLPALLGAIVIVIGSIALSRSPLALADGVDHPLPAAELAETAPRCELT
ncbi:MAG: DMT family transporter [Mycobacteriales bacterium]|nr:MAG: hypothetical protein DLM56_11725 [Pseudonocardiales bacterium]